jgi:tetratricopeptide (TPR) repeat protein
MKRTQTLALGLAVLMPVLMMNHSAAAEGAQTLSPGAIADLNTESPAADSGDTAAAPDEEIRRLFLQYRQARSTYMLDEADTLAKRIVDLSIREYGVDDRTTAIALTNLADLQSTSEDNVAAMQNFAQAIEIVERVDGRLSSDLITPLRGMGAALLRAGDTNHARQAWDRAVHISHVNYGPHNFEQIETLYSLGRMFRKAGMGKEAMRIQKRISYLRYRDNTTGTIGEPEESKD